MSTNSRGNLPIGWSLAILGDLRVDHGASIDPAKFPQVFEDAGLKIPISPVLEALLDRKPVKHRVDVNPSSVRSFIESKF